MALLIREYTCRKTELSTYTIKVLDKRGHIAKKYECINSEVFNLILDQYKNHSIVDHVNVSKKQFLK